MTTLTIGTFNVYRKASIQDFVSDVSAVLRTNVDVVGLQECKGQRPELLSRLPGWDAYLPDTKRADYDPIVWRSSRFKLTSCGSRRVAKGLRSIRGSVPVRYANWVGLEDLVTGATIFIINTHVHASIERRGRPLWWRPRTRQAYRHLAALAELAEYLGQRGEVFITGDFNIDWWADARVQHPRFPYKTLYRHGGLVPCWSWSRARGGTHGRGGRKIDYVWHRRSASVESVKARILRDDFHSDHNPVLVTYNITKEN